MLRRATGFLIALHNINMRYPRRMYWKLISGRLPSKVEWDIITRVKADKMSTACEALRRGFEWLTLFKEESTHELFEKGWLKKSDIAFAKKIAKYLY